MLSIIISPILLLIICLITCNYDKHETEITCKFKFSKITVDQITDEMNAISNNKAAGLDGISRKAFELWYNCYCSCSL